MAQYKAKPVTVHASKWLQHGDHAKVERWPSTDSKHHPSEGSLYTVRGTVRVHSGDWVIRGVYGDYSVCPGDQFHSHYYPIGTHTEITGDG